MIFAVQCGREWESGIQRERIFRVRTWPGNTVGWLPVNSCSIVSRRRGRGA